MLGSRWGIGNLDSSQQMCCVCFPRTGKAGLRDRSWANSASAQAPCPSPLEGAELPATSSDPPQGHQPSPLPFVGKGSRDAELSALSQASKLARAGGKDSPASRACARNHWTVLPPGSLPVPLSPVSCTSLLCLARCDLQSHAFPSPARTLDTSLSSPAHSRQKPTATSPVEAPVWFWW